MKKNRQHQTRAAVPSSVILTLRLTPRERQDLQRKADAKGLTVSALIRQAVA